MTYLNLHCFDFLRIIVRAIYKFCNFTNFTQTGSAQIITNSSTNNYQKNSLQIVLNVFYLTWK